MITSNIYSPKTISVVSTIATSLIILLFAYAAVSKLTDFETFRHQLHNQNIPKGLATPLAYIIPGVELLTIVLLLRSRTFQAGLLLSMLLLAGFTAYVGLVLFHYWNKVPCSCGGILNHMSWTFHFWFNCFFLCIAIAAYILTRPQKF